MLSHKRNELSESAETVISTKGGYLSGGISPDDLVDTAKIFPSRVLRFEADLVQTQNTHGTG